MNVTVPALKSPVIKLFVVLFAIYNLFEIAVCVLPASNPNKTFPEPVTVSPASTPSAVLEFPDTFWSNAPVPIPVFDWPVVVEYNAPAPTPVL